MKKKKIVVSVISDLVTDQRVHKVCSFLHDQQADVLLIGRCFNDSPQLKARQYSTRRIQCLFRKGVMQYLEFNLRLFIVLCFQRTDLFLSNDLDTLLPNFLHARLRFKPLIYDSHEYFTGVPELMHRHSKRNIWKSLENFLLPRIRYAYTVNESISEKYREEYGIKMKVVRNLPVYNETNDCKEIKIADEERTLLIMQGSGINPDRGYEEAIQAMQYLPSSYLLLIIGGGTKWDELQEMTKSLSLNDKVKFIPRVPFEILRCYTRQAHLGLSLDKPVALNYHLSLPNKLFDYLHAGVPVLTSNLTEVQKIVTGYNVGKCVDEVEPRKIAAAIESIMEDKQRYQQWKDNTKIAAKELCWQKEEEQLHEIFDELLET